MPDDLIPGPADPSFVANAEPLREPPAQPDFQQVVSARYQRRDVLRGGLGFALSAVMGGLLNPRVASAFGAGAGQGVSSRLGFAAVPVSSRDAVELPPGYRVQVILPWGEPLCGDYPAFSARNGAAEQAQQVGSHHDAMHFFPLQGSDTDGLLVINHEYAEPRFLHAGSAGLALAVHDVPLRADGSRDPDQVLKEIHAHGVSVARIRRDAQGLWQLQRDARNRRITAATPMQISGPLRGDPRMRTAWSRDGTRARGTLNNCAHGVTPWGTYLACEENWRDYFVRDRGPAPVTLTRYGVEPMDSWRWHLAAGNAEEDPGQFARFDASRRGESAEEDFRNEPHAFGWVVEIDPFDPQSEPVKRTHLGRFAHEGVIFAPAVEGRPVVLYSGDDARFEYIYKFVSSRPYHAALADGSLLDEGTLYAAKFASDGSGEWLALAPGKNGLTAVQGFASLADILLNARGAADLAGATPMDRPEWGALDPENGQLYFSLTKNKQRTPQQTDSVNPRAHNRHGQIVRWREAGDDHTATAFEWELFLLAGDERQGRNLQGDPLTLDNRFSNPDGLWFDRDRRLWIQTDISDEDLNTRGWSSFGNNALLAADPDTGEVRRFLVGPRGAEITGCVGTADGTTLFVNVQHPGASTGAEDFAHGRLQSYWPDGGPAMPRSATLVITREDGGVVGAG